METQLLSSEQVLQGPFTTSIFLKNGFAGFAAMKSGSLHITNKRIILEGARGGLSNFTSTKSEGGETLTDTLSVVAAKNIIIPLESIKDMKRAKFFISSKVIRVFGEGISEQGWRIVFNGPGFLKVVQQFIDMGIWKDDVPMALKISRHLS